MIRLMIKELDLRLEEEARTIIVVYTSTIEPISAVPNDTLTK